LAVTGRGEEALVEFRKALSLDLPSPMAIKLGLPKLNGPKYDAWIEQSPSSDHSPWDFTALFQSSVREVERFDAVLLNYRRFGVAAQGVGYANAGQLEKARQIALELERKSETDYVDPTAIAAIYSALKDTDSALKWLEKAFQAHSGTLVELKVEHGWAVWEPLRSDSRYSLLMEKLGLNPTE
jgi:hypothetical protein